MTEKKISGLILNGGRSSRMGFDKGELSFHGTPQREYLSALLRKFCDDVYTSCKNASDKTQHHVIADKFFIESPLNGILSALDFNHTTAWLTVPVDMPGVDEEILRTLVAGRDPNAIATCFLDEDGKKPEPLVTIWEPAAYPLMKDFYLKGKISPREFLMNVDCRIIIAPNRQFFKNINTPEELKIFKEGKGQRE